MIIIGDAIERYCGEGRGCLGQALTRFCFSVKIIVPGRLTAGQATSLSSGEKIVLQMALLVGI
jgi:hypothetical protein